jgi:hypothetical protein
MSTEAEARWERTQKRQEAISEAIDRNLRRTDLTPDDILRLVVAARLNTCSDNTFAGAVGGSGILHR